MLVPARTLADAAKSLGHGEQLTIALSSGGDRRGDHRLLRRRAPGARPGCSTPVPALPHAAAHGLGLLGRGLGGPVRRGGQAGRPARRSRHAGPAGVRRRRGRACRPAARTRAGPRSSSRSTSRASRSPPPSTRSSCSTAWARWRPPTARLLFTSSNKPVVLRPDGPSRRRLHVPDHAGPAAQLSRRHRPCTSGTCPSPTSAAGRAPRSRSSQAPRCFVGVERAGQDEPGRGARLPRDAGQPPGPDRRAAGAGRRRARGRAGRGRLGWARAAGRARDHAGPGQPGPAQRRRRTRPRDIARRCCARCCSRRRISPSCAATRASAAASSTS